ncbi:MAG TPA: metallophosphoesterase [Sedimentisphaerales bacterium]|nr:metallophosphoesterase [Sedimentisphaerales bacterium]
MSVVLKREISYTSRRDMFRLVFLSDIHLGSKHCDERLLRETVESIKRSKNAFWIGLGDYCEWINVRDPRYQESETASWLWGVDDKAEEQKRRIQSRLEPIADKCVGLIEGNHEFAIKKHTERDVFRGLVEGFIKTRREKGITEPLGLGPDGFIRLIFRRSEKGATWTCDVYATHGAAGGRKAGAKALRLQDLHRTHEAHIIVMGHSHEPLVLPAEIRLRAGRGPNALASVTHSVNAGCFLGTEGAGWPEYARRRDYPPSLASVVEAWIEPDKERVRIIA